MNVEDALMVLRERRDYLNQRIAAKTTVGWDVEWDVRERDALTAVIRDLNQPTEQPSPTPNIGRPEVGARP